MTQPEARRSILVVDDDVVILRLLRGVFASFVTCSLDATPSPEYAFELALRKPYDLFLFDFQMPGVDGAVLYGFLRMTFEYGGPKPRPLPPLLIMTGHGEQQRARQLLRQPGVRGLLPKPFSIDRLLKVPETALPGSTHGFIPPPPAA